MYFYLNCLNEKKTRMRRTYQNHSQQNSLGTVVCAQILESNYLKEKRQEIINKYFSNDILFLKLVNVVGVVKRGGGQ